MLFFCLFAACVTAYAQEEAFTYNSYGRRDPFVPLIGIQKKAGVGGVRSVLTIDDLSLEGILVNPDGSKSVILNGDIMKEGQRIGRLTVEKIRTNDVTIKLNDVSYELKLYQEKY